VICGERIGNDKTIREGAASHGRLKAMTALMAILGLSKRFKSPIRWANGIFRFRERGGLCTDLAGALFNFLTQSRPS
jgi:hypothetical protein